MTRGWKITIGIVGGLIALNATLAGVRALTGGSPGGPTSSSYATSPGGVAAYADLLAAHGHAIERLRHSPAAADLSPADTVVVLDPSFVLADERQALDRFVRDGGRLIAGGGGAESLVRGLVGDAVEWSARSLRAGRVVAPVPELARVARVETDGSGLWAESGSALPAYVGSRGSLLSVASLGDGRVLLLADTSPLRNDLIDEADNAALGLGLVGEPHRRVVFAESYHGYGEASGVAAIPDRWGVLLAIGAVAVAALMLARGRRLGPAEPQARELAPPRRAYAESLGGVLARTRGRQAAAARVRAEALRLLAARTGLPPDAEGERVRRAAAGLGLPEDEAAALAAPEDRDLLAGGRALARLARTATRRNVWRT